MTEKAFLLELDIEDEHYRKWVYVIGNGYPGITLDSGQERLARVLMNCPVDKWVDHKDGNPWNNKKDNLRICSAAQNNFNRNKTDKKKSSVYKGVSYKKSHKKWRASIMYLYIATELGLFDTEIEAALAYNKAAIKKFGEFAKLNEINYE